MIGSQPGHRTKTMLFSQGLFALLVAENEANLLALKIIPKVVVGKSQGNSRTTLRKGVGFFLSREGSLTYF